MYETAVCQQEAVDRRPINEATFEGEVFEIRARVGKAFAVPFFSQLNTAAEVEIAYERAGSGDDSNQSIGGDVLVIFGRIEVAPKLAVKAHAVPGFAHSRTTDKLLSRLV